MSEAPKPPPGLQLLPWPEMDFSQFGPVESKPLSRIQQFVAANLLRNWVMIPHVTHNDDADITVMEAYRKDKAAQTGTKLTPLAFLVKAAVAALKQYPQFNASLAADGKTIVMKQYWHIGIAVDTPAGLVVPVIRDADQKSLAEIAAEISDKSTRARTKGLPMAEMMGGCFSISSLGGIGGTSFSPIINAPELAVMGVVKAYRKPFEAADGGIEWRTMLPLSLSYDHRAINGADAARFCVAMAQALADPASLDV